jgi:hypothetical protein
MLPVTRSPLLMFRVTSPVPSLSPLLLRVMMFRVPLRATVRVSRYPVRVRVTGTLSESSPRVGRALGPVAHSMPVTRTPGPSLVPALAIFKWNADFKLLFFFNLTCDSGHCQAASGTVGVRVCRSQSESR